MLLVRHKIYFYGSIVNFISIQGVAGMLETLRDKLEQECLTEDQRKFYQSAVYAYEVCGKNNTIT